VKTAKPAATLSHAPTPYIVVKGATKAIQFYVDVFGASELYRLSETGRDKIGHAELEIGGGKVMLADEYPDFGALSPASIGGSPVSMHLYVHDVDAVVKRATDFGATVLRQAKDEFFGDRVATIVDPFGHRWQIATRKENVAPAEMQKRWTEMMS
jgi:PhnB protein